MLLAGCDRALEALAEAVVHRLELELRPLPNGFIAGLRRRRLAVLVCRSAAAASVGRGSRPEFGRRKMEPVRRLRPRAAISQAVGARRNPSPRARADGVRGARLGVQNEPLAM